MKYVWASLLTLAVLAIFGCGVILVHRRASALKTKIALDAIVAVVSGVVGLASQTFIGVLQVFPSDTVQSTPKKTSPTVVCPTKYTSALLQLWPSTVQRGSRLVVAGDGFPANEIIMISIYGKKSHSSEKFDDIGAIRADACGKFNYLWHIPDSLIATGYRSVEIDARRPNPNASGGAECCHATATLTVYVGR